MLDDLTHDAGQRIIGPCKWNVLGPGF
jgi:hypothetical protein